MSPELQNALTILANVLALVLYALYQRWKLEQRTAEAAKAGAKEVVRSEVVPQLQENTATTNKIYDTVNGGKFERLCGLVEGIDRRVAALEQKVPPAELKLRP